MKLGRSKTRKPPSALHVLFVLIASVFSVEFLIMLILTGSSVQEIHEAVIDGGTLVLLLFPIFYFSVYRPMLDEISKRVETERFRDSYAHGLSHDLKNPLTTIQLKAQMIERITSQDDEALGLRKQCVEAILKSVERIRAMIQDLVESSRLESGQVHSPPKKIELHSFVSELLQRSSETLDCKRHCALDIPPSIPPVFANPENLERILVNLIGNARKYSPPETQVRITAQESKRAVTISVEDHGVGIPKDELPFVFARFYRTEAAKGKEGLGLGLYITKILVETNGGRIWVESQVGKGSTFHFNLPVAK